jgi:hypothetical protein
MVDHAHGRVLIAADADVPVGGAVRTELVGQVRAPRLPENLAARRSLFSTVGGFRTDRSTAADVDWHARAMDAGVGHAFVDDVVLRRVLRADSTSNSDTNSRAANAGLLASLHASIQRRRGAP